MPKPIQRNHGKAVTVEENEKRYNSYLQGGTVQQMADRAGVSLGTFSSWMSRNKMCAPKKKKVYNNVMPFKQRDISYIHTRPKYEIEAMNKFLYTLVHAASKGHKDWPVDVMNFINEYRK